MNDIVWVLGAGQLGQMLKQAAYPLALDLRTIETDDPLNFEIGNNDFITVEREHWPDTPSTLALSQHSNFINQQLLATLANRATQKQLLDDLGLANAAWQVVDENTKVEQLFNHFGDKVLLKQCSGGYDGKGQHWLRQSEPNQAIPEGWAGHAIAEQVIPFEEELSIIGMRHINGEMGFYPLASNLHQNGMLMATVAASPRQQKLQVQAQEMLAKLMSSQNYVGLMAMECFQVGEQLLINEIAPRVHNSGHWTQAGCSINQFEAHLRAVTHKPLVQPLVKQQGVMINLIGIDYNPDWLSVAGAEVYWYGKEVRPARKVGHINLAIADKAQRNASLKALKAMFNQDYQYSFEWIEQHLD